MLPLSASSRRDVVANETEARIAGCSSEATLTLAEAKGLFNDEE
jgi:hypothetical protein